MRQGTVRSLRANDTAGPSPGGPAGGCGGRAGTGVIPGVNAGWDPKISVRIHDAATPTSINAAVTPVGNPAGPHRYVSASCGRSSPRSSCADSRPAVS